jgi:hypothetical protein
MKHHWLITCALSLAAGLSVESAAGQAPKPRPEPQLSSVFPLGASQGARISVELRGQNLDNAYAFWSDCAAIRGEIKSIEPVKPEGDGKAAKGQPVLKVMAEFVVAPDANLGQHAFRIIGPLGVSNPLPFFVYQEPVTVETDLPLDGSPSARRISRLPTVVSGTLGTAGEVDSYLFEAEAAQELFFEVLHAGRTDPQMAIYERAGSWFDSKALRRLAFNDEPNTASKNLSPALTYRFEHKGSFLVNVTGFLGRGGPESSYQLRIVPAAQKGFPMSGPKPAHELEGRWQERSFARELRLDRLKALRSRAVEVANVKPGTPDESKAVSTVPAAPVEVQPMPEKRRATPATELVLTAEHESSLSTDEAAAITLPTLIDGKIDSPGDVDRFKFHVEDGARLVFEIETPRKPAPLFTPRIGLFDENGHEVLSNVFAFVQGSGEFIEKVHEPKVTYKFERGGDYLLEVRDLTSRNGGPLCEYRVVVRPQLPHVGRLAVCLSFGRTFDGTITNGPEVLQLNLVPGESKKISILTEHEEGFDGQVAVSFEDLPAGVEVLPAAEVEPERARPLDEGKKERFRPGQQMITVLLAAAPDAPATRLPQLARVKARPVVNGKIGETIVVQSLPIMVVNAEESVAKADRKDAETPN